MRSVPWAPLIINISTPTIICTLPTTSDIYTWVSKTASATQKGQITKKNTIIKSIGSSFSVCIFVGMQAYIRRVGAQ